MEEVRIMTYNVFEGASGKIEQLCDYLRGLNLDVLTLNELNGWDEESLKKNAAAWGHMYSIILPNHTNFRVGISSRYPFEILFANAEDFLHGTVGVRILNKLNVITIHMNPRTAQARLKEAKDLMKLTEPLKDQLTLILGDLNTLSPADSHHYESLKIAEEFSTHSKLQQKFLTNENQIDYSIIQTIEENFSDLSTLPHTQSSTLQFTVPTDILLDPMHASTLRLDYAFGSSSILPYVLSCERQVSPITSSLSDHFPVLLRLRFQLK